MGLGQARENFGTVSRSYFCLKSARKGKSGSFERSYLVSGTWGTFGTVSQFFIVRKSALEAKLYGALIILGMGLGRASENFGTECTDHVFV